MIKRSCLCAALMLALAGTSPVLAQSEDQHVVELQAQDLGTALKLLAQQTKLQIVYSADLVQGKRAPALKGSLTATDALNQLLRGSGLKYEFLDSQTVTLSPVDASIPEQSAEAGGLSAAGTVPIADGEHAAVPPVPTGQDQPQLPSASSDRAQDLEKITVTGTRIRGGATPSPVITIGSERIQEEGFTNFGEVIRSVPQNFSGGQNPGVAVGGSSAGGSANQNITGGSSLNLRGLGADATLTLLNGRRLSYGGFVQAVDISAIPVEAVERIEIVVDGASAIYGSDAVGGVGNVILKRDYDGVTVGARYGGTTDGGLTTREYTITAGTTWSSGGLIATYKDVAVDPIYAADRDYTNFLIDPTTIYPGSDLRSGLFSAYQSFGDIAELRVDALRTKREQLYYYYLGSNSSLLNKITPETTTSIVSSTLEFSLRNDWTLSLGATLGEDEHVQDHSRVTVATATSQPYIYACWGCNKATSYEVGAEGRLFALPGGDARLAVGAGYRENEFRQINYIEGNFNTLSLEGDESSRFAYAELNLPFVGPESSIAGVRRLALAAAVRGEDYDSFGSVSTPKLGLIYGPNADVTFKASWGKSFKAPTLFQRYYIAQAVLYSAAFFGGTGYPANATALSTWGGDPDLQAERATSWAASIAFHPQSLTGLEAELTWFDIDYTDRVVAPITDFSNALNNPNYVEFIELYPTEGRLVEIIARYPSVINASGAAYDPNNVVAIISAQNVNVARQRIRGLDLSGSYAFDLGDGRMTVRGSASYLDSTQQNFAVQTSYDIAGTIFNPAKVNSRVGAVWSQGGFAASTFINYTGGVTDTVNNEKLASFTTFDATLRYAIAQRAGALSGLEFALSAQNLFNREPPLYRAVLNRPPYDSTNYSAIGRFLSLSVSKHW